RQVRSLIGAPVRATVQREVATAALLPVAGKGEVPVQELPPPAEIQIPCERGIRTAAPAAGELRAQVVIDRPVPPEIGDLPRMTGVPHDIGEGEARRDEAAAPTFLQTLDEEG